MQKKQPINWAKKHIDLINYTIIFVLLLLSCYFEFCAYILVAFNILLAICYNFEKSVQILLFTFPFQLAFNSSKTNSLYLIMFIAFAIIMLVKYIIKLFEYKKNINFKTLSPILLFITYLVLPFHQISVSAIIAYIVLYLFIYLIFEYRSELNFKRLLLSLISGLILSCFLCLTIYTSQRIQAISPVVYPLEKCTFIRFAGLFPHPNDLATTVVVCLSFLCALFYKGELKLWQFLCTFWVLFALGYLSISRDFVIALAVLFLVVTIFYTIKYKKKSIKILGLLFFGTCVIIASCFYETKIYLVRFNVLPSSSLNLTSKEEINHDPPAEKTDEWWNSVYDGETHYDPGRREIWKLYFNDWKSSTKNILFGKGLTATPIGQMNSHNLFLQLLWMHGIFGYIIYLLLALSFINFKKLFKSLTYLVIVFAPLFVCFCLETFNNTPKNIIIFLLTAAMLNLKDVEKSDFVKTNSAICSNTQLANTKISIIITLYNEEKFIKKCIQSAQNQTYRNIEIIIVDDGSTDKSPEICNILAQTDERIKIIHKENGGISSARNYGIAHATGNYICFIDGDDFIQPNLCEEIINDISYNKSDIVMYGYNKITDKYLESKTPSKTQAEITSIELFDTLADNHWSVVIWNKAIKKDIIYEKFDENYKGSEDFLFNSQFFKRPFKISSISKPLYNYINKPNIGKKSSRYNMDDITNFSIRLYDQLNIPYAELPHVNAIILRNILKSLCTTAHLGKSYMISTIKKNSNQIFALAKNAKSSNLAMKTMIFLLKKNYINLFSTLIMIKSKL